MTTGRDGQLEWPSEPGSHAWTRHSLHVVPLASFAGAFLGCLATLHLSTLGLPPALASVTATLLLCAGLITVPTRDLLPTTFASSVYGGSFSGMTPIVALSESVARSGLPVDRSFILLSLFCGLVFCSVCAIELRLRVVLLRGYGGRFGALAAVGSFLFLSLAPVLGGDGVPLRVAGLERFDKGLGESLLMLALCSAGMFATMFAQRLPQVAGSGRAARVFVSAAVAGVGLVSLQQLTSAEIGLYDAYYAGCFVGMSSPRRLRGLVHPLLAAALTIFLLQAAAILPSVGGSLGLVACVAVVGIDTAHRLISGSAPLHDHPKLLVLGKSLAAAFTVGCLLLPNKIFDASQVGETTGSIVPVETPAVSPSPAVQAEATVTAVPIGTPAHMPPAVPSKPEAVPPVGAPARTEPPRRRASRPVAVAVPARPFDPEPWRIIRARPPAPPRAATASGSQPAPAKQRSQVRVPAPASAPPRATPRPQPERAQDPPPSGAETR